MSLDAIRSTVERSKRIQADLRDMDDDMRAFDGRTATRVRDVIRAWDLVVYFVEQEVQRIESEALHRFNAENANSVDGRAL